MIEYNLKEAMIVTSKLERTEEIFKHVKAFMGSPADKGNGYATKNAKFYIGDEAKQIIKAFLIDGLKDDQWKERFDFIKDWKNFSIGPTLIAHGIQTQQPGIMKDVENASKVISNWVDFIEDKMEWK